MIRRLHPALALGLAAGLLAGLSACGSASGEATVTVTEQVQQAPSGAPDVTVPGDPGSDETNSSDADAPKAEPETTTPTTASSKSDPTTPAPPKSTSSRAGTTKSGTTKSGSNPDPGYVIPTANDPDVSRDVPGPEGGTKCATNAKYYDEAPTGMRPDVIAAWHHLEKVANAQGIIVCLNDGKRSSAQQQAQYDEYVQEYGKEVADQLVLSPEKSAHVTGDAMDVQPQAAYQFLQSTKGSLGLCRIYDNEPWHFEYDVKYFTQGCPARLPKPEN